MPDETRAIEPALSADEWRHAQTPGEIGARLMVSALGLALADPRVPATMMALANVALPDDDPRKITRAMVKRISGASKGDMGDDPELDRIADVLAALLPPEG